MPQDPNLTRYFVGLSMPSNLSASAHTIEVMKNFRRSFIEVIGQVITLPLADDDTGPTTQFTLEPSRSGGYGLGPLWTNEIELSFRSEVQDHLQTAANDAAEAAETDPPTITLDTPIAAGCAPSGGVWYSQRYYPLFLDGEQWLCNEVVEHFEREYYSGDIPQPDRSLLSVMPVCVLYTYETPFVD